MEDKGNTVQRDSEDPSGTPSASSSSTMDSPQARGDVGLSVRKKGKYKGDDLVDKYLLNQIVKHFKYEELGTLARDLNIEQNFNTNIPSRKDQIWEVSKICKRIAIYGTNG